MEIESLLYISEKNSCRGWLVNLCWLSDLVWQKISKDKQRPICVILYVQSLRATFERDIEDLDRWRSWWPPLYKLLTINLPLLRDGPDNEALNSDSKHSRPSMETIIDLSRALSLSLVSPVTCPHRYILFKNAHALVIGKSSSYLGLWKKIKTLHCKRTILVTGNLPIKNCVMHIICHYLEGYF